jgi:hypothetical protein
VSIWPTLAPPEPVPIIGLTSAAGSLTRDDAVLADTVLADAAASGDTAAVAPGAAVRTVSPARTAAAGTTRADSDRNMAAPSLGDVINTFVPPCTQSHKIFGY